MTDIAIRVDNLGKRYRLGRRERYRTLRESITRMAGVPWRWLRNGQTSPHQQGNLWALRELSFDVHQGDIIGIIGRNGAGKSTLLKILSRITDPTTGEVTVFGRVGSLLEVGTGFHPELTGRENVFLNGAILGMKRSEVIRKFDDIVAFAEVEQFIDTPVKHYSSGMYMRLAFAVAAHLDPEILIVDEVLAVGDAEFQKKCLGKMGEVARDGRTVLFISHHLASIESLTQNYLVGSWADAHVWQDGHRLSGLPSTNAEGNCLLGALHARHGTGEVRVVRLEMQTLDGEKRTYFKPLEPFQMLLGVRAESPRRTDLAIVFETQNEQPLFTTHLSDLRPAPLVEGYQEFVVTIQPNTLRTGSYAVSLAAFAPGMVSFYDTVLHIPAFEIEGNPEEGFVPHDSRWGPLYFPFRWETCR